MTERSTSLDLPYIQPTQAQKHVTHNEAVELLDMLVQLTVQSFGDDTPPVAPQEGQTWFVGSAPTDGWAGGSDQLASYRSGGWLFINPREGWRAYDVSTGDLKIYADSAWQAAGFDTNSLDGLGVNATYDATNLLSVSSDAALFSHSGAGHQIKINKANIAEAASLLFQTNWSGRAEMGTMGGDDFEIKVSADGTNWSTGLTVRSSDSAVEVEALLNLKPAPEPVSPTTGDVYFDATSSKLRCYDGSIWNDLF